MTILFFVTRKHASFGHSTYSQNHYGRLSHLTAIYGKTPHTILSIFIRPSSDGTYYGMVMSVRPSQFSALFSYMLWHIDLKFCVSLYIYARKIKFECYQFPSLFAGVMLLFNLKLLQICSFPHFSPTCFDILIWNFVCHFIFMHVRSSSNAINFR